MHATGVYSVYTDRRERLHGASKRKLRHTASEDDILQMKVNRCEGFVST